MQLVDKPPVAFNPSTTWLLRNPRGELSLWSNGVRVEGANKIFLGHNEQGPIVIVNLMLTDIQIGELPLREVSG